MAFKQAVVLCAGAGTRMLPDTADKPTCMLDVAGQPAIRRTAEWLVGQGVEEVYVNLHHRPDPVVALFKEHRNFGMKAVLKVEPKLRGTAGGIANFIEFIENDFLVVFGDVVTNLTLTRLEAAHKGRWLTVVSHEVDNPQECGVIVPGYGDKIERFVEKPERPESRLVNAGVMAMHPSVTALIPRVGESDIGRDLLSFFDGRPHDAHHLPLLPSEWLYSVGTRPNYELAQRKLA